MSEKMRFQIINDDILRATTDIIALKYADSFYGVDSAVATAIGYSGHLKIGEYAFVRGSGIRAREVLFVGVGPLGDFRYEEMRKFGQFVLEKVTKERPEAIALALTIHGPGYGLDEREAFFSLVGGLLQARQFHRSQLTDVRLFEKSAKRANRLRPLLKGSGDRGDSSLIIAEALKEYGVKSETKPRLFVAMPFTPKYLDEYEIAFSEAAHRNGFLCERLDFETFVGDIFAEIKERILSSNGVIALLNEGNPNVYLEIGYAMAHSKPVIFVVKKGTKVPFDIRGQRYLEYSRIGELREALASDISKLHEHGVFNKRQ